MAIIEHACYYENMISGVSHCHTSCELIYLCNGNMEVKIKDKTYILSNNDCILIKSGQHHTITISSDNEYKRFIVFLNPWELKKQLVRPDLFILLTDISKSGVVILQKRPDLEHNFQRMSDLFCNKHNIYNELAESLGILSPIYDVVMPTTEKTNKTSSQRLSEAVRNFIEKEYAYNIKISKIAEENFVSTGYLTHIFKYETGMSPREYLSHIRCTRAYELIIHTRMKISEISDATGFSCANDMSRKIREYFGRTPTEIRKES